MYLRDLNLIFCTPILLLHYVHARSCCTMNNLISRHLAINSSINLYKTTINTISIYKHYLLHEDNTYAVRIVPDQQHVHSRILYNYVLDNFLYFVYIDR